MEPLSDTEKVNLIRDALQAVKSGKMNPESFCIVAGDVIEPQGIESGDVSWAISVINSDRTAEQRNEAVAEAQNSACTCDWIPYTWARFPEDDCPIHGTPNSKRA